MESDNQIGQWQERNEKRVRERLSCPRCDYALRQWRGRGSISGDTRCSAMWEGRGPTLELSNRTLTTSALQRDEVASTSGLLRVLACRAGGVEPQPSREGLLCVR